MYLGILAGTTRRFKEAARHFAAALAAHEPESPLWAARTRYYWASTILSDHDGDTDLAFRLLDDAIRSALALGMSDLAERAGRLRPASRRETTPAYT